ncbi:MAG: hypothetical protein ACMVO3_23090 [Thalassobaculum sp.]
MSKKAGKPKSPTRQADVAESSRKTLTESGGDLVAKARESAEKPVSLAPLGFEDALKGLLATGRKR